MIRKTLTTFFMLAGAAIALGQTVTVTLGSSKNGLAVGPGDSIDWSISFTDSTGDNQGVALVLADLVQDPNNPSFVNLPYASSGVPSGMSNFSRPSGISNAGEGGNTTGYVGVQRGSAGALNLIQLGGGQNTFGTARTGTGLGESATVLAGVGQSGAQTLASGSFSAPAQCGSYTVELSNVIANVLSQRNSPPSYSPVVQANVTLAAGSISFSVGLLGDIDGNGVIDLTDLATLLAHYGQTGVNIPGDLDHNGVVDLTDLATQLAHYGQSCS